MGSMKHKKGVLDGSKILSSSRKKRVGRLDPVVNLYIKKKLNDSSHDESQILQLLERNLSPSPKPNPKMSILTKQNLANYSGSKKKVTECSTTNSSSTRITKGFSSKKNSSRH